MVVVDGDYASLEARGAQMTDATLGIKHETYDLADVAALAKGMVVGPDYMMEQPAVTDGVKTPRPGGLADLVPEGEPDVVVQRWLSHANQGRLMASIGTNANGAVRVDLRELGPHALVRGEVDGFIPGVAHRTRSRLQPERCELLLGRLRRRWSIPDLPKSAPIQSADCRIPRSLI